MESGFICEPCGYISTNRYNYDIHLNTLKHRAKTSGLKCPRCFANYDSKNKLTRHMRNVHPEPTEVIPVVILKKPVIKKRIKKIVPVEEI